MKFRVDLFAPKMKFDSIKIYRKDTMKVKYTCVDCGHQQFRDVESFTVWNQSIDCPRCFHASTFMRPKDLIDVPRRRCPLNHGIDNKTVCLGHLTKMESIDFWNPLYPVESKGMQIFEDCQIVHGDGWETGEWANPTSTPYFFRYADSTYNPNPDQLPVLVEDFMVGIQYFLGMLAQCDVDWPSLAWFIPWTRVVNKFKEPFDVYIGRPGYWGNPFPIECIGTKGQDEARRICIDQFESWLMKQPSLLERAKRELAGKVLGCFCKPKECHGDVLARVCWEADHGRRADELWDIQAGMIKPIQIFECRPG